MTEIQSTDSRLTEWNRIACHYGADADAYLRIVKMACSEDDGGPVAPLCRRYRFSTHEYDNFYDEESTWPHLFAMVLIHMISAIGDAEQRGVHYPSHSNSPNKWSTILKFMYTRPESYIAVNLVFIQEEYHISPLYLAVQCRSVVLVESLLAHGADPTVIVRDTFGNTMYASHFAYVSNSRSKRSMVSPLDRIRIISILNDAERRQIRMMMGGEWRPRKHKKYPPDVRLCMRNLVLLAKTRAATQHHHTGAERGALRYPRACLHLLPEELLQYVYAYVISAPYFQCIETSNIYRDSYGWNRTLDEESYSDSGEPSDE